MNKQTLRFPLLLTLVCLFTLGYAQSPKGYQIGDIVTDFSLKNVDENMVSLVDYQEAKGFIVIVSCNSCPWVKRYEDRMIELHNEYASQGYPVVAINPNDVTRSPGDSFEAMQVRSKEKGFPFDYLYDETQEIAKAFGASYTPEAFVLKKTTDGLKLMYHGAIDDSPREASSVEERFVGQAVNSLIEGESPEKPRAKGIGCSVKYRAS
ncbi:MAG: thioredoxin family protein [Bacteroidota bacterium]